MADGVFEGRTVEEALDLACKELGLPLERLKIEVISSGSTGVFGLGLKKAKIQVTVIEPQPEEPREEKIEAEKILEELIALLNFDLAVESGRENDTEVLKVSGKDAGLLIGKRGQTINALQYILNKMLSKKAGEKNQVILDCEGYRERRKVYLTELAMRLKERVRRTGESAYTDLLNAMDRRVIHVALHNDPVVRTRSIGDGQLKKVVIYAKGKERSRGSNPAKRSS